MSVLYRLMLLTAQLYSTRDGKVRPSLSSPSPVMSNPAISVAPIVRHV